MHEVLKRLGINDVNSGVFAGEWLENPGGETIESVNPATGELLARVQTADQADYDCCVESSQAAFLKWRVVPPPKRGEIVRQISNALRENKDDLGMLVTLEMGKILSEGLGEVQEMIDMGDFAVGLSRQLYGLTIASERPQHRLFEQWHPLGPVGIITAFNFPVAVWAWNAMLSTICGSSNLWKPSSLTPLTAIAVQNIVQSVVGETEWSAQFNVCIDADSEAGKSMAADQRLPLISATGSCEMGRSVGQTVAGRLGRSLLELGGNNGLIVAPSANLDLALRGVTFAAVGTAGQRCTSLRRLFLHEEVADEFIAKLVNVYSTLTIGEPWQEGVLVGPLASQKSVEQMEAAVTEIQATGGEIVCGGKRINRPGCFVEPTIVRVTNDLPIVARETFAPILYVMTYSDLSEVIERHNSVPQGLSSAIFTDRLQEAERFLSAAGSDCGIANVNIGTSGAEIGGAFGGEKETGGGREAGSDAWKAYMRRQTCTVNWGDDLPLAQGVTFSTDGA